MIQMGRSTTYCLPLGSKISSQLLRGFDLLDTRYISLFLATKWRFLFSFCIPESRPEDGFGYRVPGLLQCANGQATPCSQHFVTMDPIASICILEYLSKLEHQYSQASKVTGFKMWI